MAAGSYHHGNLRQALLDQAVELARAGGPDAVVMRDVQRAVGVSNAAAYRHYSDRDALLAAVRTHAMSLLGETMLAALARVPTRGPRGPRALARLRATGRAYVDFALTEPGLFRAAFAPGPDLAGKATVESSGTDCSADDTPPDRHPFQILSGCIDDLVTAGLLDPRNRDGLDEAAWASVHGLSVLYLEGPLAADDARRTVITERLLDVIGAGLH